MCSLRPGRGVVRTTAARKLARLLVLGCWLLCPALAAGEVSVGLSSGLVVPGDQDLAFKEYSTEHQVARRVDTDNVNESIGPFVGANVTGWAEWSFLRYFGLQLEGVYWHVDVKPGVPVTPAPRFTISEHRAGVFANVLGRLPLYPLFGRFSDGKGADTFAYAGAGTGAVYTSVAHGSHQWDAAYQLLGGLSVPLVSNLRLRLETRYILTSDVDTSPRDKLVGWKVDTSGTPTTFRKNETLDTRFFPVLFGLDWRF